MFGKTLSLVLSIFDMHGYSGMQPSCVTNHLYNFPTTVYI